MAGGYCAGQCGSPHPTPHFNMTEIGCHLKVDVKQSSPLFFPPPAKAALKSMCLLMESRRQENNGVINLCIPSGLFIRMLYMGKGYSLMLSHNVPFPQVIECSYLAIRHVSFNHSGCLQSFNFINNVVMNILVHVAVSIKQIPRSWIAGSSGKNI